MKKILSIAFIFITLMSLSLTVSAKDYIYAASADGELSLHISPDENSYTITRVPSCAKLELINKERTWGLVSFENKAGWINLSFTRNSYNAAAEATGNSFSKTVEVVSENKMANLYTLPTTSQLLGSKVKHTVPEGSVLTVTRETAAGWGLVFMNGKYAWVQMKETRPYKAEYSDTDSFSIYYVYALSKDGTGVPLWKNPSAKSVLKVIPDCTRLTVRKENNHLGYVSYDGANGWIDLRHSATSLEIAQIRAGEEVNCECEITPPDGEERVDLLRVPSTESASGTSVIGSVAKGEIVYILREIASGWSLINYNGELGWLPPQCTSPYEGTSAGKTQMLDIMEKGFAVVKEKGKVELFAAAYSDAAVAKLPDCTEVKKLAQSGDYIYVYCDYAAGWANKDEIAATYEEAIDFHKKLKRTQYIALQECATSPVPAFDEILMPASGEIINAGTFFRVKKVSSFRKVKWGLAEIDGTWKWIELTGAKNVEKERNILILTLCLVALAVIVILTVLFIIKRKKERADKNEIGKDIHSECSGAQERTSDVRSK